MTSVFGSVGQTFARMVGRRSLVDSIQPGARFCKVHPDTMVETAEVVSIEHDWKGIPHVQYHVDFMRQSRTVIDGGMRILALKSFADRYREPVTG